MKHHSSFDCDYDIKQNEHIVFYEKPVLRNDNEQWGGYNQYNANLIVWLFTV